MITNGKLGIGDKVLISGTIVEIGVDFIAIEIQTGEKAKQIVKIYNSDSSIIMPL